MKKLIRATTTLTYLHGLKLDYATWKAAVYQAISQTKELPVSEAEQKYQQWFSTGGYGTKHFSQLASFQALERPHRAFHNFARQAAEAAKLSDVSKLTQCLADFEQQSQMIVQVIERLQQDIATA